MILFCKHVPEASDDDPFTYLSKVESILQSRTPFCVKVKVISNGVLYLMVAQSPVAHGKVMKHPEMVQDFPKSLAKFPSVIIRTRVKHSVQSWCTTPLM